jgi:hypothetical protein
MCVREPHLNGQLTAGLFQETIQKLQASFFLFQRL